MTDSVPLIGENGLTYLALYLLLLIGFGALGKKAMKEDSLSDFYLAGRVLGTPVLFLTLYATQYSGNTLIGFAGKAYRGGYESIVMVVFMTSVIGGYFIYAPKLHRLSKKHNYITMGDYIQHRFNCSGLTYFAVGLSIIALGNYILTNLKAIGHIMEHSTHGVIGFTEAIIGLSIIMVIYETLGGMRSVAWTDTIQAIMLLVGAVLIFFLIQIEYGNIVETGNIIQKQNPEMFHPPSLEKKINWFSTICLAFFGISIYPHAIQRIYASRDEKSLIQSFQIMAFMPFITTLFIVIVGWTGIAHFPGLSDTQSENITMIILEDLGKRIPFMGIFIVIFLSAVIAAIMSTVDSALLAISSMMANDVYKKLNPKKTQSELTNFGKISSWLIMSIAVLLAINVPQTIWRIMEIKLELLCQIAPCMFLGIHFKNIQSKSIFVGMIVGTVVSVGLIIVNALYPSFPSKPLGLHNGVWGLLINFIFVFLINWSREN